MIPLIQFLPCHPSWLINHMSRIVKGQVICKDSSFRSHPVIESRSRIRRQNMGCDRFNLIFHNPI